MKTTAGRIAAPGLERRVAEHVLEELLAHERRGHERAEHDDPGAGGDPEDAARGDVEVVQRVRGALLPQVEGDPGREGEHAEHDCRRFQARHGREVDPEDERPDQDDREDAAEVVHRLGRLVHVRGHELERHDEGDADERQRHEEHRAPPELLEQRAGDERAERRDAAAERRPERDRLGARLVRPRAR